MSGPETGGKAQAAAAPAGAAPAFRRASAALGALTAAGGLAVLCGWAFDMPLLRSVLPGMVEMKANTAVCFVLLGSGLWLLQEAPRPRWAAKAALLAAGLCLLVSGLTLVEYAAGLDLGLDQLLFMEPPGAILTSAPGRMALNSSVAFVFSSASLIALAAGGELSCALAQALAGSATVLGFVSLVGFLYDLSPLYFGLHFSTAMALHTTLLFTSAGLGLILARPDRGLMRPVSAGGLGGLVFRTLFPVTVALPVLLGWLKLAAERRGLLGPEMGLSLVTIANMLLACALVYLLSLHVGRLEEARRRAEAELQAAQRLESLGQLAGGIAHDFNNLLVGIVGGLSLLRRRTAGDPEALALAAEAAAAAEKARALAVQLLTFAKGGRPLLKPMDAARTLAEAAQLAVRGTPCSCDISIEPGLPAVLADETQLAQALSSLARNAAEAMPGGGAVRLRAELRPEPPAGLPPGRYVALSVADSGPGIPPDVLPRIFEPYFTTKAAGRGLGLSAARSIAARHGGLVTVETSGGGSVFSLFLPATAAEPEKPAGPAPRAAAGRGRVLVMDDEEIVQRSAARMLKALGYESVAVQDGAAALEAWRAAEAAGSPFDLVIMDLTIPGGMGGAEAAPKLKAVSPGAKVLVSSGYSSDPVTEAPGRYGFDAVLAKPYKLEELAAALEKLNVGR